MLIVCLPVSLVIYRKQQLQLPGNAEGCQPIGSEATVEQLSVVLRLGYDITIL